MSFSNELDGEIPARLGRALGAKYEVRRRIGRGGFAEVYEVWDKDLERRLAVKVLSPDVSWTPGMLDRFRQEARSVAKLNHPNILTIHFVGEGEGLVYYAMPFVDGHSLADLLRTSGALDPARALKMVTAVLDALGHAHERGLIHRDIKPENIMIEAANGKPLLVDFGIAKQVGAGKGVTQTGFVVGTPQYMSPEQALGDSKLDARTDIYSMGAVLFQMVTGAPPFDGDTSQEIVAKHISEPPPVPAKRDARIPRWMSDVIVQCLAKNPGERFQTAERVAHALTQGSVTGSAESVAAAAVAKKVAEDATALLPSHARPATTVPRPSAPANVPAAKAPRRRWPAMVIGVALVGALAAAGYLVLGRASFQIENRLVEPIRVSFAGQDVVVPAGQVMSWRIDGGETLAARWTLVRPTMADDKPMGREMDGVIEVEEPQGRTTLVVESRRGERAYFAPLITNATDRPLSVTVNAGLQGSLSCGCMVAPGATRQAIGYYELFANSSVRVEDPDGRTAIFSNLGPNVNAVDGSVGLRFETKDLR